MKMELIFFSIGIGCLIVAFVTISGSPVSQTWDSYGITFKYRNSQIRMSWEQLEGMKKEIADVQIMLWQLSEMYNRESIQAYIISKMERLKERVKL